MTIETATKICKKCGVEKQVDSFHFRKDTGKHRGTCKICWGEKTKAWAEANREKSNAIKKAYEARNKDKVSEYRSGWKKENREKLNEQQRTRRADNPEREKEYGRIAYARDPVRMKERARRWREANPGKAYSSVKKYLSSPLNRERMNRRRRERRDFDAAYVINHRMRNRARTSLLEAGCKGGRLWERLVGYTSQQLRNHLEAQFRDGMSWERMSEWEIDHITPLASFSIKEVGDAEFMAAWSLGNLRPLWRNENRAKGAKKAFLL